MNVRFFTLGCKVNQYETAMLTERMLSQGFSLAEEGEEADVIVINSCTVTGEGDSKARKLLRRCRREHPNAVIAVTGCYPQAVPGAPDQLPEADIVTGTVMRASLTDDIARFLSDRRRIVHIQKHTREEPFEPMCVHSFPERTRAFVKIQDGCNRYCAYCLIPTARGMIRSKPLGDIRNELAGLAAAGYREIVLVGINLSAYGEECGKTLADAVEAAGSIEGVERIRLGSLEPELLSPEVIARLSRVTKLCPQFHLSLQSGCAGTLRRMNRRYTPEEYETVVQDLRAAFADCAITTDIMVGFPGETEEEFAQSLAFSRRVAFAKAHIFAYSPRPNTRAAAAPDQVPNAVKDERSRRMIAATGIDRREFLKSQLDRRFPVLFEQPAAPGVWEGYTPNYTPVRAASERDLSGQILSVRLTEAFDDWCAGVIEP